MSDEMSGGRTKDESIPFNYEFSYSLVNTKLDEKESRAIRKSCHIILIRFGMRKKTIKENL